MIDIENHTHGALGNRPGGHSQIDCRWPYIRKIDIDRCRAIDFHRIEPVVDKVYPVEQARAAFDTMAKGGHFGKIVLDF